jgi:hypothetical protein
MVVVAAGSYADPGGVAMATKSLELASARASIPLEMGWIPGEMPHTRDEGVAAAGEAVFWLSVLDEAERHRLRDSYVSTRAADQNGQVVIGLLWARNALAHGATVVSEGSNHSEVTATRGPDGDSRVEHVSSRRALRWRRVGDIAVRDRGRALRPSYERHVAGRWVKETLDEGQEWFRHVAAM